MCGIAGVFDAALPRSAAAGLAAKMLAQLEHRGPDSFGLARGDGWALGSARLAIVDIAGGGQPMASVDGRFRLVLNGEIFNFVELRRELELHGHRFRTRSDTEVLLYALVQWGAGALPRLEGQFAFAFLDTERGDALLARDRFGERPLYFRRHGRRIAFASEVKGLFALPDVAREVDPVAVLHACLLWGTLPTETAFTGIEALAPGQAATVRDGHMTVRRWAHPTVPGPRFAGDMAAARGELRRRVRASIERRLRSDVEVACYLSGGVDSAIVASVAHDLLGRKVRTFSVTFSDPMLDESTWQQTVAQHLGTEHHATHIGPGAIAAVFPEVVRHAEMPLFRAAPAPLYLLAKAVREAGIKVVLTGEGADEAFLGYHLFKETQFRRDFNLFPDDDARYAALTALHPYLPHFRDGRASALLGFYREHLGEETAGMFSHEPRFALGRFALRLLRPQARAGADAAARFSRWMCDAHPGFLEAGSTDQARAIEYVSLLGGYLLSAQGDRMSSAHGVEGRYPFTDHNVVELALSFPESFCLRDGVEKAVLREAFADALPPRVSLRPKQPYRSADATAFLHGRPPEWLEALLTPANLAASSVFEPAMAGRLVARLRGLAPEAISPREDQAAILLISTLLLEQIFVHDFVAKDAAVVEQRLAVSLEA